MKLLSYLFLLSINLVNHVYADALIKLVSDQHDSEVFINGEIIGSYIDMPLEFILPPGNYRLEVKKDYNNQSQGYYSKDIKVGSLDIKMPINAALQTQYSELHYYKQANTVSGAETYLQKFPTGKYAQAVANRLEMEYAQKATTIKGAETYLEKYPSGKFSKKISEYVAKAHAKKNERDFLIADINKLENKIIAHLNSRAFNYKIAESGFGGDKTTYTSRAQRVKTCKIKSKSSFQWPTHSRFSETIYITDEYNYSFFMKFNSKGRYKSDEDKNKQWQRELAKKCAALQKLKQ